MGSGKKNVAHHRENYPGWDCYRGFPFTFSQKTSPQPRHHRLRISPPGPCHLEQLARHHLGDGLLVRIRGPGNGPLDNVGEELTAQGEPTGRHLEEEVVDDILVLGMHAGDGHGSGMGLADEELVAGQPDPWVRVLEFRIARSRNLFRAKQGVRKCCGIKGDKLDAAGTRKIGSLSTC
jgi:hypothetical protein